MSGCQAPPPHVTAHIISYLGGREIRNPKSEIRNAGVGGAVSIDSKRPVWYKYGPFLLGRGVE